MKRERISRIFKRMANAAFVVDGKQLSKFGKDMFSFTGLLPLDQVDHIEGLFARRQLASLTTYYRAS